MEPQAFHRLRVTWEGGVGKATQARVVAEWNSGKRKAGESKGGK